MSNEIESAPAADVKPVERPVPATPSPGVPPLRLPNRRSSQILNLIIAVALGVAAMLVWDVRGPDPTDGSRWATVFALVEQHTFAIDNTPWAKTVDRVRIGEHFYSSKPPLLPTVVAGEYFLIKKWSGNRLRLNNEQTRNVVRIITATINFLPLIFFLILFKRLLGSLTTQLWTQVFTMLVASASYLVALSALLVNHTVGAYTAFFAAFLAYRIWYDRRRTTWRFALCGLFIGLTVTVELSAVLFLALLLAAFVAIDWRRSIAFALFALVPLAAHLYLTHLITGGWSPQYSHEDWYLYPGSFWVRSPAGHLVGSSAIDSLWEPWPTYLLNMVIGHHGVFSSQPALLFALLGIFRAAIGRDRHRSLAVVAFVLTVSLFVIYTFFTGHRNYAGMTSLPRYYLWLFPLWLMMIPAGVSWGARWAFWRAIAMLFLLIGGFSACYSSRVPWRLPWQHEVWKYFTTLPF